MPTNRHTNEIGWKNQTKLVANDMRDAGTPDLLIEFAFLQIYIKPVKIKTYKKYRSFGISNSMKEDIQINRMLDWRMWECIRRWIKMPSKENEMKETLSVYVNLMVDRVKESVFEWFEWFEFRRNGKMRQATLLKCIRRLLCFLSIIYTQHRCVCYGLD